MSDPDPHRWWVLVAVGIGTFMSALDSSIVNTVLPLLGFVVFVIPFLLIQGRGGGSYIMAALTC